jgi:hypothetical protein
MLSLGFLRFVFLSPNSRANFGEIPVKLDVLYYQTSHINPPFRRRLPPTRFPSTVSLGRLFPVPSQ